MAFSVTNSIARSRLVARVLVVGPESIELRE
jgi:hypothetical protein